MPAGRPSEYREATADAICDRVAEGENITDICDDEGFPSYTTLRRWISGNEEFAKRIARAHEDKADYYRDRIQRLNDSMDKENWQYVNAQIRNIQWLMGKMKPKAYGDNAKLEHVGDGGGPVQAEITVKFVK